MSDSGDKIPMVLTIAGTDPSGGAGINVDLQVFRDHGCHGLAAITAVVWQNTRRVGGWRAVTPRELEAQLALVGEDLDLSAVKIGMLPTARLVGETARFVDALPAGISVVFDPVMASGSGRQVMMDDDAVGALDALADCVDLVTPNGPEARGLAGEQMATDVPEELALAVVDRGWKRVLLTGGHLRDGDTAVRDWYAEPAGVQALDEMDAVAADVRGTGCQLSSAIAAGRARGRSWLDAIDTARRYLHRRLTDDARHIGGGRPVVVRAEGVQ